VIRSVYLGFLDLVQIRVADAFIREGLSPQKVRKAIEYGSEIILSDYPFASARFKTDGKTVILSLSSHGRRRSADRSFQNRGSM